MSCEHREGSFAGMARLSLEADGLTYGCPECRARTRLPRCEVSTRSGARCANPARRRVCRYHAALGVQVGPSTSGP